MLVFSTGGLPATERADATSSAMHAQSVPCTVEFDDPGDVRARMDVWLFGRANIFRAEMNGFRLLRTRRQIDTAPAEMFAVALHEQCTGRYEQFGVQRVVPANRLMIMDLNAPYDYSLAGQGAARCLHIPVDELDLPHEVVRAAADRLPASPLYAMTVDHITALTDDADRLCAGAGAEALGRAGADIVRALVASAYDPGYARGALAEMLLPRIRAHVRRHLGDPGLTVETIAARHGISTRRLYKLCADADFSLEQWIIGERLSRARDDLSRPELAALPIAAVARRWGFANTSHFGRRFKQLYGMSPRAWRRFATQRPPGG